MSLVAPDLLRTVPLPLREQADAGVPLVAEDPDDPAAQALRQTARGIIAITPAVLPMLQADTPEPPPLQVIKPAGMSLPMAG